MGRDLDLAETYFVAWRENPLRYSRLVHVHDKCTFILFIYVKRATFSILE